MNEAKTICVPAGQTVGLMARAKHPTTNVYITQLAVSAIRVDVYKLDDDCRVPINSDGTVITDGSPFASPNKTDIVHDTLQTDSRWTSSPEGDSTGYNVLYNFTPSTIGINYEVRMKITMTDGTFLVPVWSVESR